MNTPVLALAAAIGLILVSDPTYAQTSPAAATPTAPATTTPPATADEAAAARD